MADNKEQSEKKEQAVYKFGQKELDLNKYIHNLGTNLQTYMDKKTHWSDGQKQEFINAYNTYIQGLVDQRDNNTNRFYTDDAGQIYDTSGVLSSRDDDGIDPSGSEYYYDSEGKQITTDDYNQLRKRKQKGYNTFSANKEVASYFNQIGRALSPAEKKAKEKFDVQKHGFVTHWNKANSKSGEKMDLKPFLDMDKFDPETGERALTNRMGYLSKQLTDYMNGLEDNYEWEGANYKSMGDYKASLQNLLDHMSDGVWDNNDEIAANQAGIGGSFYKAFFTKDEHPNLTDEDREKIKKEREQKERDEAWQNEVKRRYDVYEGTKGQWHSENPYHITLNDYNDENGNFNVTKWADSFTSSHPYWKEIKQDKNYKNYFKKFFENPFTSEASRVLPYLLSNSQMSRQLSDGRYYISEYNDDGTSKDEQTNSVLIYDPTKGTLSRNFIGDVKDVWDNIKSNYGHSQGWSSPYERYYKEGGTIDFLQFGGGIDINAAINNSLDNELNQRAQASGKKVKEQKADERRIGTIGNRAEDTAVNDSKFTDVEYARIGSAIADIAAIGLSAAGVVSAGVGTVGAAAAGLGSTGFNLYADIRDKGVTGWQTIKNLGLNLGMDVIGLIPGGGAASKGAKVLKSLGKTLPKVALAVSATSAFANRDEILASLQKATSNPKDMNVGDWQNLAQALSLVSGASQVAGAAFNKSAKIKQAEFNTNNNVKNKVIVDVADASGNKRSVLFDGDDAVAIRAAREKGGKEGASEINNILGKYENTKEWTVQQEVKNGLQKGDKWWKPKYGDTGKGSVSVRDINADGDGAYLDNGLFKVDQRLTENGQNATLTRKKNGVDVSEDMVRLTKDDTIDAIAKAKTETQQAIIDELKPDLDNFVTQKSEAEAKVKAARERVEKWKSKIGTDTADNARARIAEIEARQATPEYATRKSNVSALETSVQRNQASLDRVNQKLEGMVEPVAPTKPKRVNQPKKPVEPIKPKDYATNAKAKAKYDVAKAEYDTNVSKYEAAYKAYEVRKAEQDRNWPAYEKALSDYKKAKKKYDSDVKRLNTQKEKLSGQIASDNATIKSENEWLGDAEKSTLEGRLNDLLSRDNVLRRQEAILQSRQSKLDSFTGGRPQSYQDWINSHSDLDGNIIWDLPGGRKSDAITKEAFEKILQEAGIQFTKRGGTLNVNNVRKFYNGGSSVTGLATTKPEVEKEQTTPQAVTDFFGKRSINPTLTYGLPRAIYANSVNRKLTDMQINAEKPLILNNANLPQRKVTGDINSEIQGQQNKANLNRMASHAQTSSAEAQMAMQLEAAVKGEEFANQGKMQSNAVQKQQEELALQEARQEAQTRQAVANENQRSMMQSEKNKNAYEMAYESKKKEIFDTVWSQFEYDAKVKQAENKAYEQQLTKNNIDNAISHNLKDYVGDMLSPDELQIWNDVQSGVKKTSELSEPERYSYLRAYDVAEQLKNKMFANYLGISVPNMGVYQHQKSTEQPEDDSWIRISKNGSKLETIRAKAKQADADRFQKAIKDAHDKHQKMLDQLSDSIYGFINASLD